MTINPNVNPNRTVGQPARIQAIKDELESAAREYEVARDAFEKARVHFQVASERLASTKELASLAMDSLDWYRWRKEHFTVRYAANQIGPAIAEVLVDRAFFAASGYVTGEDPSYSPEITQERIISDLDQGGFEFRSPTPGREVNAALIKMKGRTKMGESLYQAEDAEAILEAAKLEWDTGELELG